MGVKVREKKTGSGDWWIFIDHKGRRKAKKIGKAKKIALAMEGIGYLNGFFQIRLVLLLIVITGERVFFIRLLKKLVSGE